MNSSWLKTLVLSIVSALIAGALVYLFMQRRLWRLQEQLIAQTTQADAAKSRSEAADKTAQVVRDQDEKDQTELLRLRGEVGRLRQQRDESDKVRKQNEELNAALSRMLPVPSGATDPEHDPEQVTAVGHLNDARQLVLGLLMFADDNQQVLPSSLNQTSNYWGNSSRLSTNQFELVLQRPFSEVENPSTVIAVRQKQPWQRQGHWVKAYGFADGHAELKREPPEGFEAWEQAHIQPPR